MSDVDSEDLEDEGPNFGTYVGDRNDAEERHGKGVAHLPNGDVYDGEYYCGKRHGKVCKCLGMYKFKSGARYIGEYMENKKHGQGLFYYPDGSSYNGMWASDLRNGQGTYTYINGDTYEGEWSNNLRHGMGSYTYSSSGAKYIGNWMNGRRDAVGELIYANYRYKGSFSADQPNGPGCYTFDVGCKQVGDYVVENKEKDNPGDDEETPVVSTMVWRGAKISGT